MYRLQGITILAAALIFLSGCAQTGSTGDGESARVEGSVARAIYDKIMLSRSGYKNLPAKKKTLSACINWAGTSETSVDLRYSMAYYEGEFSERTVPTGELMNSAMLECEREQKNQNLNCECVPVDRNGSPVLLVPKSVGQEAGTTGSGSTTVSDQPKTDDTICRLALSSREGDPRWDDRMAPRNSVAEAKRRGLTPEKCVAVLTESQ